MLRVYNACVTIIQIPNSPVGPKPCPSQVKGDQGITCSTRGVQMVVSVLPVTVQTGSVCRQINAIQNNLGTNPPISSS